MRDLTTELDERGWTSVPTLGLDRAAAMALALDTMLGELDPRDRRSGDRPAADTRRLTALDERMPELVAEVLDHETLRTAVAHLVGADATLSEATYRCPGPGGGGQRLHVDDLPKLDARPARVATAIVTLTDFADDNGATRVVPGSHLRPDLQRRAGSLDRHPDEEVLTEPAGTAFVFSGHLLHRGTPNRSTAPRPAIQLVWRRQGTDPAGGGRARAARPGEAMARH